MTVDVDAGFAVTPAIDAEFAEAYRRAALAGADMREAANAIEHARALIMTSRDSHSTADALSGLVNDTAEGSPLTPVLAALRDAWVARETAATIETIAGRLRDNSEYGMAAWLVAIGDAVAECRFDIARQIAAAPLALPADQLSTRTPMVRWLEAANGLRWREARGLFEALGYEPRLSDLSRCRAKSMLAELDLAVRNDLEGARKTLRSAEALAPDDWRVAYTWGRLHEAGDSPEAIAAAVASYTQASRSAPGVALPQVQLGFLRLKQGDVPGAEALFLTAARSASGPSNAYCALIELAGRKEQFESRRSRIAPLVERVRLIRLDAGEEYDAMISAANAFASNGATSDALGWLQAAILFDGTRIGAYLSRGYLHLDDERYEEARQDFAQVTAIAPDAVDGHWGMLNLAGETKDWLRLLRSATRCINRAPDWRAGIQIRLEKQALALYTEEGQPRLAALYYRVLRRLLGDGYEPSFRNLSGNLLFYERKFALAAEEYRLAEAAAPKEPRYPANLAGALEAADVADEDVAATLSEALAAATRALELKSQSKEFLQLRDRLTRARLLVAEHGAAVRRLTPDASLVRLYLHTSLLPLVLEGGKLSRAFTQRIDALRKQVAADFGFTLCGVSVREWTNVPGLLAGSWTLIAAGKRVHDGRFDLPDSGSTADAAPTDPAPYIEQFAAEIVRILPYLVGPDEAREIAKKRPDGAAIIGSPELLVAFTRAARDMLRETGRIDRDALPAPAAPAVGESTPPIDETPGPSVVLRIGAELFQAPDVPLPFIGTRTQAQVHALTGVITPQINVTRDAALQAGEWTLAIGDQRVPLPAFDPRWIAENAIDALAAVLTGHAAEFIGPIPVTFQMDELAKTIPTLVSCARALLPMPVLLAALRAAVRDRAPIDFLAVLEEWTMDWENTNARFKDAPERLSVAMRS